MRYFLFLLLFLLTHTAWALPSFTGRYGGINGGSSFLGRLSARNILSEIEIGALPSLCQVTIPGTEQLPLEQRSTTITRRETRTVRLRSNGNFSGSFQLPSTNRVDFRGATVTLQGRIRGGRGFVNISLQYSQSYEDGSSEACSGSIRINLRRSSSPRR